jgi:iron complex outermembrane receptor protein
MTTALYKLWGGGLVRLSAVAVAICFSVACWSHADDSHASIKQETHIPPQPLGTALQTLAKDRGFQVVYESTDINPLRTNGATGELTSEEALTQLLSGTGLTYRFYDDNAVSILPVSATALRQALSASGDPPPQQQAPTNSLRLAQAVGAPAAAGSSVDKPADSQQPAPPQSDPLQEIIVTGSRIARAGFKAPTPTTVVGSDQLQNVSATNVGTALNQEVPALTPSLTPTTSTRSSQNAGGNFLDLRSLGANRTLVLVDGSRFVPTTSIGTVDTNVIPSTLIERVDVVTGGASAAYGSDAVAGVVNIILKKDFNGFEGKVQGGLSELGDDASRDVSLAWGAPFAAGRGHIEIAGEYEDDSGVTNVTSRSWARAQYGLISNPAYTATNGQPQELMAPNVQLGIATGGGLILSGPAAGTQFLPGGGTGPFVMGNPAGGTLMSGGNGINPGVYQVLSVPLDRENVYGRLSFEINPSITAFAEGSWARAHTFNPSLTPSFDFGSTIQPDNAYLPATLRSAAPFAFGEFNTWDLIEAANTNQTQRFLGGLSGSLGSQWTWEADAQYGRNRYNAYLFNNLNTSHYALAEDAVVNPANGQTVCRSTLTTPDNGCVPIDVFGGTPSQAAINYVTGTQSLDTELTQTAAQANIQGEPFADWAGPVSVAFGGEYRRLTLDTTVDALSAEQAFLIGNPQPIAGHYSVTEAFGETLVPLVRDLPLIRALDFNGAVRVTHYSTSGTVTTWKAGLSYSMTDELRLRATRSRDIRAANLAELFTSSQLLFTTIADPATGQNVLARTISVGNPNLKPEKADTTTVGPVYQPAWLPGFSVSADYYNIDISGAIAQLGAQDIVTRCADGDTALCSFVTRDANNLPSQVTLTYLNIASIQTNGVDIESSYNRTLANGDKLALRVLGNYVNRLSSADGITSIDLAGYVGTSIGGIGTGNSGLPHWRANASQSYQRGPFTFYLEQRFIGGGHYTNFYTVSDNDIGARLYLNGTLSANVGAGVQVYATINNILDKAPPRDPENFLEPAQTNAVLYDVIGRAFTLGVRAHF